MELNICRNMAVAPNHRLFTLPHTPPNRPLSATKTLFSARVRLVERLGDRLSPTPAEARHDGAGRRCFCARAAAGARWGRGLWPASLPAAAGGSAILNVERPRARVGAGRPGGAATLLVSGFFLAGLVCTGGRGSTDTAAGLVPGREAPPRDDAERKPETSPH